MNDDRIVAYLRERGRVMPPPGLVTSVMDAVDAAPPAHSWFTAYLPAAAVAGVVALVIAVSVLLNQAPRVGPPPLASDGASPSATTITLDELEAAVTAATERLAASARVTALQTWTIEGFRGSATWFDWRPDGDQIVRVSQDLDVVAPWWTDPEGEPLSVGERIRTTVTMIVGDGYYVIEDGAWAVVADRADAPRGPLAYGIGMLSGEVPAVPPRATEPEGIATRRELADGIEGWAVEVDQDGQTAVIEWTIDGDGRLRSYAIQGSGVSLFPGEDFGTADVASRIEFDAFRDADPIPPPDPDTLPDERDLGIPPGLPFGDP